MAKVKTVYSCTECGASVPKWQGQCPGCGVWNTLVETIAETAPTSNSRFAALGGTTKLQTLSEIEAREEDRLPTGIAEFDRALGGGLVAGGVVLLGGDPGIGKSTLLLQALAELAGAHHVLYVSGEESGQQIAMRARRLALDTRKLKLLSEINLEKILAALQAEKPQVAVIDSIQTLWSEQLSSAPGSVVQVRECAAQLTRLAKQTGINVILVGHVTKEGALAGPRVLEHMVDAVMYFEGDRGHQFRILRAAKNRFGATDEIGVFEMTDRGLAEVPNPSALFLAERRGNIAGSAVFAGLEGTRPVLLEIQVLLSPNAGSSPRRAVVGWDAGRLNMLLAVLETRCGLKLSGMDVYLNVAGGLRIQEPAADLAVAAALASAASGQPTSAGSVYFGEVGLSGEVRQVAQAEARLKEAHKLGFEHVFLPRRVARGRNRLVAPDGIRLEEIGHLADLTAKDHS